MRRFFMLNMFVLLTLFGCSNESENDIFVGWRVTADVIMEHHEELGNDYYEFEEFGEEDDSYAINFSNLENIEFFNNEVPFISYALYKGLEEDSDDVLLGAINLKFDVMDSEQVDDLVKDMTKEYGEPEAVSGDRFAWETDESYIRFDPSTSVITIIEVNFYKEIEKKAEREEKIDKYKSEAIEEAEDFALPQVNKNVDKDEITLSDYEGKGVILTFWETYSELSEEELPALEELKSKDLHGIEILTISSDSSEFITDNFVNNFDITLPILYDENGWVAQLYNVAAIPTTFFIDSEGMIIKKVQGLLESDRLEEYTKKIQPKE